MAFQALLFDAMMRAGRITELDVVRLHDGLTYDGPVTAEEAKILFAIEQAPEAKHHAWKGFFIDAITIHAINDVAPDGYLTAHKADWLIRYGAPQGRILTRNTYALLTSLVATARWVPERLVATLFDEVYCAIATGNGPLRETLNAPPGVITERDCDVIRHILYSAGGKDTPSISRVEVEGLLAIDTASAAGPALPAWTELFCKALVDAALVASGWGGPDREITLRPEHGDLDPAALCDALGHGLARYRPLPPEDRAIAALERQRISIITGDDVRAITPAWLADAIQGYQPHSIARQMLVTALAEHRARFAPELQHIVMDQAATRAA